MSRRRTIVACAALPLVAVLASAWAADIAKCRDAEGNWYYGDRAAEQCTGGVTELKENFTSVEVLDSSTESEEQRALRKAEEDAEAERRAAEEKRRADLLLLSKYASESEIVEIRDRKIEELARKLSFNLRFLDELREHLAAAPEPGTEAAKRELQELRERIGRFEEAVAQVRSGLAKVRADYARLIERYRRIDTGE